MNMYLQPCLGGGRRVHQGEAVEKIQSEKVAPSEQPASQANW